MQELVVPYVRSCIEKQTVPTAVGFINHHKNTPSTASYEFFFLVTTVFGQSLFNLRAAIRRNNGALAEASKHYLKDLLWATQHPKYQELEVYDCVQRQFHHEDVTDFLIKHYSMITHTGSSSGEGYDYRMEELNRNMKSFLTNSQLPTDEQWLQTAKLCQPLQDLHEHLLETLNLIRYMSPSTTRLLKSSIFDESVKKCLVIIRSSNFLTQNVVEVDGVSTFRSMDGNTHVHPDVMNLSTKPIVWRNHYIKCTYLNEEPIISPEINYPVLPHLLNMKNSLLLAVRKRNSLKTK